MVRLQFVLFNSFNSIAGINWTAFAIGCLVLGIYCASYCTEVVRGGVLAVPANVVRAARSLGLSYAQTLRYITLPLAARIQPRSDRITVRNLRGMFCPSAMASSRTGPVRPVRLVRLSLRAGRAAQKEGGNASEVLVQTRYPDHPLYHALMAHDYQSFADDDAMLSALLANAPRVVSFHFGLPDAERIRALKQTGCLLLASATNLDEALACKTAGVDAIVAQGWEAGGHRGMLDPDDEDSRLGTLA